MTARPSRSDGVVITTSCHKLVGTPRVTTAMDRRVVVKYVDNPNGKGILGFADEESAQKKRDAKKAARREYKKGQAKLYRLRKKQMELEQLPRKLHAEDGFVVCEAPEELQGDKEGSGRGEE